MLDQKNGHIKVITNKTDGIHQFLSFIGVHTSCRLIQKKKLRLCCQCSGNLQLSLLTIEKVYKRFPRLKERQNQTAGTLSGGEQQMLAMGRALMSQPKIILMDEPSMGLSPIFVNEIFDIIKEVSESGTTVLLVEQNAKKALSIADRAYVLETGRITLEGKASDLLHDESVQKAYLGE